MVPAGSVAACSRGPRASPVESIFGGGCFLFPPLQFFFWQSFKTGSSTGGSTSPSRRAERTLKFTTEKVIGNGSFGVVYEARIIETGETVAIKKVLQDRRFKNRELQIMKELSHPNIVKLKHCFYTTGNEPDEVYLNLVLEFIPETSYQVLRSYIRAKRHFPLLFTKLYIYQLCRALAYIHSLGVCHRDIKPQNLLVNPKTHELKLCDFGSAKVLVPGEPNVAYICSRYYRAPELIFGATQYTCSIDMWSCGCMLGELLLGQPLFPGESGLEQIVEIIKVVGTPTAAEIMAMNPGYSDSSLPQVEAQPWPKVFKSRPHVTPDAMDLLSKMLVYTPTGRVDPLTALDHPFFDEIRDPETRLPSGDPLPPLFNFTQSELAPVVHLAPRLIPPHARNPDNWPPGLYDGAVMGAGGGGVGSA